MEIPINGQLESLIMNQPCTVDLRRIGDFLDEISGQELDKIRKIVVGLILRKNIKIVKPGDKPGSRDYSPSTRTLRYC